jgi:hypothetical protein
MLEHADKPTAKTENADTRRIKGYFMKVSFKKSKGQNAQKDACWNGSTGLTLGNKQPGICKQKPRHAM